jgi:hypothetical protein
MAVLFAHAIEAEPGSPSNAEVMTEHDGKILKIDFLNEIVSGKPKELETEFSNLIIEADFAGEPR